VSIQPGDLLLVRTGRWVKRAQDGPWEARRLLAGLHPSVAPWLRSKDIAAIGCDGITDALPSGIEGFGNPLHVILLVGMGTPILDNLDLDALAEEAAARGRWTFLFSAAPIRFPGGMGSPLNPIAIF
jgi:kynurenine formamidase